MFFALGVLGFLFAGWAPGYIAIAISGMKSHLPPLAGPFAASLIINNLLVEVLVMGGVYQRSVMLPLASITVFTAAAALIFDDRLTLQRLTTQAHAYHRAFLDSVGKEWVGSNFVTACGWLVGALLLLAVQKVVRDLMGSDILGYDSIVSWNWWSAQWASNNFPTRIWHYPQLLPVLWSIPYVVTGDSTVQYFSSSFKIVFWAMSFETLIFIAVRRRAAVLSASVPILYFLFRHWLGLTSLEDYADVPVSFFALLSGATVVANDTNNRKTAITALAIASGAAMTKQVGMYMLAATPALIVALTYEREGVLASARPMAISLVKPLLIAILAAAPMYIYAIMTIRNGTNTSELSYILNGEFGGVGYIGRINNAFVNLFNEGRLEKIVTAFVLVAGLAALDDKVFRWLLLLIAAPFTFLWAANFSYDTRNLALALPYWSLCAAAGIPTLFRATLPLRRRIPVTKQLWYTLSKNRNINKHSVAAALLLAIAVWTGVKTARMPHSAFNIRQIAIERQQLGNRPLCTEKMISVLNTFTSKHMTLSEWRWACTFHFNNSPNVCARIFPDQFDFSRKSLSQYAHTDLLIILTTSAATPQRRLQLQSAGLNSVGDVMCDQPSRFFVRRANDKD